MGGRPVDYEPERQRLQDRADHGTGETARQPGRLQRVESAWHRYAQHGRHHQPPQLGARRARATVHRSHHLVGQNQDSYRADNTSLQSYWRTSPSTLSPSNDASCTWSKTTAGLASGAARWKRTLLID